MNEERTFFGALPLVPLEKQIETADEIAAAAVILNKTSFQTEILLAARVNPNGQLIDLIKAGRTQILQLLTNRSRSVTVDLLHLYALAQAVNQRRLSTQQLAVLDNLPLEDFVEKLSYWYVQSTYFLTALEPLYKADLGIFKEIINNL